MDRLIREGNPPASQLASPVPQYKKPGSTDYEAVEGQHGAPFATLKDASGNIISPATEEKLEQARVLLNTISTKDFATQTTLAAILAKLEQLETEIQTVKANQISGDQKVQLSGTIAKQYTAANITAGRTLYIGDESHTVGGTPVKAIDISRFKKVFVKVHNMGDTPLSVCKIVFGLTGTLDEASSEEAINMGNLPAGAVLKVQLVEHLDALIPEDTIQIVKNYYPYFIFRAWAQSQQNVSFLYTGGVV